MDIEQQVDKFGETLAQRDYGITETTRELSNNVRALVDSQSTLTTGANPRVNRLFFTPMLDKRKVS